MPQRPTPAETESSALIIGDCHLVLDARRYGHLDAKMTPARPALRIDTSGCSLPRINEPQPTHPNPKGTAAIPLSSAYEPHGSAATAQPRSALDSIRTQSEYVARPNGHARAPQLQGRHSEALLASATLDAYSDSEIVEEVMLRPSSSHPLSPHSSFQEVTLDGSGVEVRLVSSLYATEIRITEIEAQDGYKTTRTIIRPTSVASSSASTRSTTSASQPRPSKQQGLSPISPIARLFSRDRSSTPAASLKAARSPLAHDTQAKTPRTSKPAWHIPSLGLSGSRKHTGRAEVRSRSSHSFEEDIDYLQAKLEKEAFGGGNNAIRIAMEVEHSVVVEKQSRTRRRQHHSPNVRRT
ncbi:hypothetical protein DFP72DRAFT_32732 [Ephemerocybe angulata]|uniref:Uncharacterized protein n=1 Tax=Ephemerocybe angulata TaxID=980116 RepID=A0A8H6I920_9AGAR|nr:hypothetical protein DFP72DRAFT_32732 [Tulosesus angulatus]